MEIRPILSALLRNKTAPFLIAAQIALTLAIVCNALYIIRDRLATASRPTGADENNLFEISLSPYRKVTDIKGMISRDLEALRAIPGVRSATRINQVPLGMSSWTNGGLTTDRKVQTDVSSALYMSMDSVIATFDLKLVEGREFTLDEITDSDPEKERYQPRLAILTLTLARQLFPEATSYAGKTFYMGREDSPEVQIVGVVERLQNPSAPAGAQAEHSMLLPVRMLSSETQYVVRTEPGQRERVMAEAEKALLAVDRERVQTSKRTFNELRERRYAGERMMAGLLISVTAFLLLITASGIVGMASLWVNQRRKQIGVRRALGARAVDILRYFLLENLLISSTGVLCGIVLALLLNDLLVRELSLTRLPLGYLGVGAAAMWLLGLLAVFGPARRAASVSPATATRTT